MIKKSGFTLAEVLVTLGIIGVVAAMTIPTLVNQTNDAEYKAGLRKIVSVLNQAVVLNYALNGIDFGDIASGTSVVDGNATLAAILRNRLNVTATNCTNNTALTTAYTAGSALCYTLNDGMQIAFSSAAANCTTKATEIGVCTIMVDINGPKKPNTVSTATDATTGIVRDIYSLSIFNQSVQPMNTAAEYVLFAQ